MIVNDGHNGRLLYDGSFQNCLFSSPVTPNVWPFGQMFGLWSSELAMGRWYRSKEKVAGMNPFGGYLSSKKWHLNEV